MAQNLDLNKLIPSSLKNETLTSLVSNLFNRFLSQEDTLLVSGRIGAEVSGDAQIQERNLERQQNALIPGLVYDAGKEKFIFTFEDFVNKFNVLDIDTINLREWMAERSYNYSPPINYDKFINYTQYYWIGKLASSDHIPTWNTNVDPEYYVIERPQPTDLTKLPVRVATTRNINRWINDRPTETFTFTFTSATGFNVSSDLVSGVAQIFPDNATISGDPDAQTKITIYGNDVVDPGNAPAIDDASNPTYPLFEMTIVNGSTPFQAGDTITITITYFTSNISFQVDSINLVGKGTVSGISTLSPYMMIDGVELQIGDRVLVKDQDDPSENGIYVVTQGGEWPLAKDSVSLVVGSRIYVIDGDTQAGNTYQVTASTPTFDAGTPGFTIPVNEWQLYNYWVHRDDLSELEELGISIDDVEQAQRPIIEYSRHIQLNGAIDLDGNPADATASGPGTVLIQQVKTRMNQIPQFDLFRYDGTHAGITSGIWYYVEDPNFDVDSVLNKRVKLTINTDFVFGCSVSDDLGRLLFYKDLSSSNTFHTIWKPGVTQGTVSTPLFFGSDSDSEGSITFHLVKPVADYQQWTVTFISATQAEIVGTRSGLVGVATVGNIFVSDDFQITINAGANPYAVNDYYTFNVYSLAAPRYVKEADDGSIVNYPGGIAADLALPEPVGAWLTPGRMFQNMHRETRNEVEFGDFLNHARSVIRWQDGFIGASFGNNNVRNLAFNPGLGGQIKEFGSNFPLLSSMLINQDLSPLTLITFVERQYQLALASIDQFVIKELPNYLANVGRIETTTIDHTADDIVALEEYFESLRAADVNLIKAFGDTTALVANWPATLPMLGVGFQNSVRSSLKTQPEVTLDPVFNTFVLVHHDGHISPLAQHDTNFNRTLAMMVVERSDGTSTPGIIATSFPLNPYARQLWFNSLSGELSVFDVSFDTDETPVGTENGEFWYQRSTDSMFEWDAFASAWVPSVETVVSRWIPFVPENIRNSLMLAVEQKLYDSVHPAQQMNINLADTQVGSIAEYYMELELASFAAKYGYDTFAPDYDPSNAFTWNYSQASFPFLPPALQVPKFQARWYVLYQAYFSSFGNGVLSTNRPDLYPWMLGTASFPAQETKPAGWDAAYANTIETTANTTSVRVVVTTNVTPPLSGLYTLDGISLNTGDKILLTGQGLPALNGIYVVSAGSWARGPETLQQGLTVSVLEGNQWAGSTWVLTTAGVITPEITPVTFAQSRTWSAQMWADIQAHNPGIRLCVNTATDALLPPYVSSSSFYAANALTNTIPPGANLGYEFGQFGPVEHLWIKSLEYKYGMARAYFHQRPLQFLDKGWGDTYIRNQGLPIERNSLTTLPAQGQLLHGERLKLVHNYSPAEAKRRINATSITWGNEFGGKVRFEVTHVANLGDSAFDDISSLRLPSSAGFPSTTFLGPSATVFSVFVNDDFVGYAFEGWPHTISHGTGANNVTFTDLILDDFGIPYELGDVLEMNFTPDTVTVEIPDEGTDFVYGLLGCEGCVSDATSDPTAIITEVEHQPTFAFVPNQTKVFKGFGQWFTNLLRFSHIDEEISTTTLAYRGWDINLVHRMGALIRPDTIKISTTSGTIPDTGYNVVLKRAVQTQNLWISALRVQLVQMGSKKLNRFGKFVPMREADDWIFRIEVYNVNHPQIDYNVLDTSGTFTEFKALNGDNSDVSWRRYNEVQSTASVTMPLQVTGLQNVLNFIYGYISQLEELGFKINETDVPLTDSKTGRNIDWQLEVEKFVDAVYAGLEAGQGVILNPFMDKLYLQTPVGLLGRFSDSKFLDPYSSQACYDVISAVIPIEQLSVVRTDPQAITYSKTPIFSAHLFVDEFEHALLFKSRFSDDQTSQLIFDQFLGSAMNTAYLTFNRQSRTDSKPTLDGFFLSGDTVLRNPSSNIDALANAYDPSLTFNEQSMSRHSLSLIGYQPKSYFSDIDVSDQVQFDFWRGMVNAKGTNLTINAFTNFKAFFNSSIDEFWAYKLATYGDARERTFPEIKINPNDCSRQFTGIQFFSSNDVSYTALPLFIQVEAFDDTRWFSIDDLGTVLRFDSADLSETVEWVKDQPDFTAIGTHYVELENIYHTGDTFNPTAAISKVEVVTIADETEEVSVGSYDITVSVINSNVLKIVVDTIPNGHKSLKVTIDVSGHTWINRTKLSPVKLFDYSTNTLVDQIGLWHPAIGIHTYDALEVINITSSIDPAHYNYTTQTTDNPGYQTLKPWNEREVGRVWWDTSKLAYSPYYDAMIFPNREARHSRWGSLAEYASIDLYQWTESDYHPSEYNEIAAQQEGDSSIDESIRLSGQVGFVNYYQANREVSIRPIAWAQKDYVGDFPAHVIDTAEVKIYRSTNRIILESGRLSDAGITSGKRLAAWLNNKPHGEALIGSDVGYEIGDDVRSEYGAVITSGANITATVEQIPNSAIFGTRVGQITLLNNTDPGDEPYEPAVYKLRMVDETGFYQDVIITGWNTELNAESTLVIPFDQFGIQIVATRTTNGDITADEIITDLTGGSNIYIRETVDYTTIVDFPSGTEIASNDPSDTDVVYEWRAWTIPTQSELNEDLPGLRAKWKPYLGDLVQIDVTPAVVKDMKLASSSLKLVSGIAIKRYETEWSSWQQLVNTEMTLISDGWLVPQFTLDDETEIDPNRLSVYANGIQLAPASLVISDNTVTGVNILPEGTSIYLLYRPYQPTEDELAFDPTVEDDFQVQTWYKIDYQYTKRTMRDSAGNITGTKYYFWVKNKTIPQAGKSMSLVQAKNLLQYGDSKYMIFSRLVSDSISSSGAAYDSCAISGLGTSVSKTNSYKLRFLRDFTLRDDPEELKLKNVHTEWQLIRQNQSSKIPPQLWLALTNAICAQDAAGNPLPSQTRINYDLKYGTRTRYGFERDQIFIDSELALDSVVNAILNTALVIDLGTTKLTDYITALGINSSTTEEELKEEWFSDTETSRATMQLIYSSARANQVNEIFFNVLHDALANNYEFTDLFKTSMITVNSATRVDEQTSSELSTEFF